MIILPIEQVCDRIAKMVIDNRLKFALVIIFIVFLMYY